MNTSLNKDPLSGDGAEEFSFVASEPSERLDVFCARYSGLTRSRIETLCRDGLIRVNGEISKKNRLLKPDDLVEFSLPMLSTIDAAPQNIPLNVVYEDEHIIVIDKEEGMVVHPAPGNPDGTLVNALLWHCKNGLSGINGKIRPGIVHRLDKDTSGLILCAKTDEAHVRVAKDIKEHKYQKKYTALIYGRLPDPQGTIRTAIGRCTTDRKRMASFPWDSPNAKNSVTHYSLLQEYEGYSLVELLLETGRTHQIRVHMKHLGHPIVADPLYAPGRPTLDSKGQLLHASELRIQHPITGKELQFVSPLPQRFLQALEKIR